VTPRRYLELELFLGGHGGLGAVGRVVVAALRDEVDRRSQAVDGQLVAVPQLVVALSQRTWVTRTRTPVFKKTTDTFVVE